MRSAEDWVKDVFKESRWIAYRRSEAEAVFRAIQADAIADAAKVISIWADQAQTEADKGDAFAPSLVIVLSRARESVLERIPPEATP